MNKEIKESLSYLIETSDKEIGIIEHITKIEGYIYGLLEINNK